MVHRWIRVGGGVRAGVMMGGPDWKLGTWVCHLGGWEPLMALVGGGVARGGGVR